jgi:hypothetical protein
MESGRIIFQKDKEHKKHKIIFIQENFPKEKNKEKDS